MSLARRKEEDRRAPITASVVIPTHRRQRLLRRMLETLARSDGSANLAAVMVIENGAEAGAAGVCDAIADRLPILYMFEEEGNQSRALNVGIAEADSDLVIFFDDDVQVGLETVAAFLRAARDYGPGHFFGGPVIPEYEQSPPPSWLAPALPYCTTGWDLGRQETTHDEFLGANWAAFKSDLLSAGSFSPALGPNESFSTLFAETELQARLRANGCSGVYVPAAEVTHYVPQSHCTLRWAWKRRYNQHMSRVLLEPLDLAAPLIGGVPRFLVRQCGEAAVKALVAQARPRESEQRVRLEMRLAELCGQAAGYRRIAKDGLLIVREAESPPA